jgi:hypothetical protein
MLPSDGWMGDAACLRACSIRCRYVCCAVAPLCVDTLVILLIFNYSAIVLVCLFILSVDIVYREYICIFQSAFSGGSIRLDVQHHTKSQIGLITECTVWT